MNLRLSLLGLYCMSLATKSVRQQIATGHMHISVIEKFCKVSGLLYVLIFLCLDMSLQLSMLPSFEREVWGGSMPDFVGDFVLIFSDGS